MTNKWSILHDRCTNCLTTKIKHRGGGLCKKCYLLMRRSNPVNKQRMLDKIKEQEKVEELEPIEIHTVEEIKTPLELIEAVKDRQKANKPCLQVVINGIDRYMPFEGFKNPKTKSGHAFNKYRKSLKEFKILKEYYEKIY